MFFFVKFAIAVLLVCIALDWRTGGSTPPVADGLRAAKARPQSATASRPAFDRTVAAGLSAARAGADALAQAAMEKCASAPANCLELARRTRAAEGR